MDPNTRGYYGATSSINFTEMTVSGVRGAFGDRKYVGILGGQPDLYNLNPNGSAAPYETESYDYDFSDIMLKYINDMLMEEDMEEKISMFQGSAALQAAERSFYEVIGEKYPASPDHTVVANVDQNIESADENNVLHYDSHGLSSAVVYEYLFPQWDFDSEELQVVQHASFEVASLPTYRSSCIAVGDVTENSLVSTQRNPNVFTNNQSMMQFQKGVEQQSIFLPNSNYLIASTWNSGLPMEAHAEETKSPPIEVEKKYEPENYHDKSRGKKNPHDEYEDSQEGRSSKQSAIYSEPPTVSSEMFDMVLLSGGEKSESALRVALQSRNTPQTGSAKGPNCGKSRGKKQRGKKNVVDLSALLTLCAQAVAANDRRTADDILKQIREHSSPTGDGMQTLAHYFANGLEARMAGSGTEIYKALLSLPTSAADTLKGYHLFLATCPFRKITNFFSNMTISNVSEKATRLHIVDFGTLWGFQWPSLIQRLSSRPGGPPKLRITGIDLLRPGFRPSARAEETGKRLANYAETFKVPFEFNYIAQRWDTIKIEDLKIEEGEVLVVNSLYKFRYLLDETVMLHSPRNIVLNLIRKMNPDVFIHGIVNAAYNSPFFISRFREALFHFTSMFDMLEAIIPREIDERMLIERLIFGRQAMNAIACENAERIDRPETYKQWQVRNIRAGFKQIPFDEEIVKTAKKRVKSTYHKDFVIDEHGHWVLQGWKGRTLYALSVWQPAD